MALQGIYSEQDEEAQRSGVPTSFPISVNLAQTNPAALRGSTLLPSRYPRFDYDSAFWADVKSEKKKKQLNFRTYEPVAISESPD